MNACTKKCQSDKTETIKINLSRNVHYLFIYVFIFYLTTGEVPVRLELPSQEIPVTLEPSSSPSEEVPSSLEPVSTSTSASTGLISLFWSFLFLTKISGASIGTRHALAFDHFGFHSTTGSCHFVYFIYFLIIFS